jgi:hypothetical protein
VLTRPLTDEDAREALELLRSEKPAMGGPKPSVKLHKASEHS